MTKIDTMELIAGEFVKKIEEMKVDFLKTESITYLSVKPEVPAKGYWDQTFLQDILDQIPTHLSDRHIFVIPTANQWDVVEQINEEINKHSKVLLFLTSDEECKFDPRKLEHDDMIVYAQYGNIGRPFPIGYTPQTREVGKTYVKKDINWFFSGQITHPRREMLKKELIKLHLDIGGNCIFTDGFAKGLDHETYLKSMQRAKVAPCSTGPVSQDSFRLYEALELGCVPVVDQRSPLKSSNDGYFEAIFPKVFFPQFSDYSNLVELVKQVLRVPAYNRYAFSSWIQYKYFIKHAIMQDLNITQSDMIVTIPVSPIPSHPDTHILEETIDSIRHHTDAPIVITFDGVREEQKHMEDDYYEFVDRMLHLINNKYTDIVPILMSKHAHQVGMMRTVLQSSTQSKILYVEQDTPLTKDPIDWKTIHSKLDSGDAKVIRFHFETQIPEPHKHLMIDQPIDGFQKTFQWSQRPHIATREIYELMMSLFSKDANCFIEDFMHGVVQNAVNENRNNWENWRIWIYHPEGSIKRSYHLDGRSGIEKYDEKQTW